MSGTSSGYTSGLLAMSVQTPGWPRWDSGGVRLWAIRPPCPGARFVEETEHRVEAEGHQSAGYEQAGAAPAAAAVDADEPVRNSAGGLLWVSKAQEEALAWQGSEDGNVTKGCLLLGFVIDEDLCIVDCLGQGPVLVAKNCARCRPVVARTSRAFQMVWFRSKSRASKGVLAVVRVSS